MLEMLLAFHLMFMSHPQVSPTTYGNYVEIVRVDFDSTTNQTYATVARFSVNSDKSVSMNWMQSRPFAGQPTKTEMLKTIKSDVGIKTVE